LGEQRSAREQGRERCSGGEAEQMLARVGANLHLRSSIQFLVS
jgi:hypothetical protein